MIRITLIIVFLVTLGLAIASGIPLSFVMRNAGLAHQGVSWQQARGTVWHGQVTGLGYRGQAIGALDVKSSPLSLLGGSFGSEINWASPAGRAYGAMSLSTSSANVSGIAAELDISRLEGVHPELRRVGGMLKLAGAAVAFDSSGRCADASGAAQLDLVRRLGVHYGRDWPMLTGAPACEDGDLQLALSGDGPNAERFEITMRALANGRAGMDIRVERLDPEANAALAALGFTNTGNGYTLRQEAAWIEEN